MPSFPQLRRAVDEGLDPAGRPLVVMLIGQDELAGPLRSGSGGGRLGIVG
jgi:hypothetical protein